MRAEIYSRTRLSQAIALLCLLWGVWPAKAAPAKAAPTFTVELKQAFLQDLVTAAAPFEKRREYEVGALGITKTIGYTVVLKDPKVQISKGNIRVPMAFEATDGTGLINASGTVSPKLVLTYDATSKSFVARLTEAELSLGGLGVSVPVESLVDPIPIPGVTPTDLELPHKKLVADVHILDIQIGEGRVRVEGRADFREAQPEEPRTP